VGISTCLETAFNDSQVPGALLAVIKGDKIDTVAFGVKNIDLADPITPDTIFDAASLSKPLSPNPVSYIWPSKFVRQRSVQSLL
jgi:hypothetical protein